MNMRGETKKIPHARRDNFFVLTKKKKKKKPTKVRSTLFITQPHYLHPVKKKLIIKNFEM